MRKTTLEGLPVLTKQTRQEVLNMSLKNPQTEVEWREKFLQGNDKLYNNLVAPLIDIYPKFSYNVNSEFVVGHEMLRRQGEIYGIRPELPHASMDAIKYVVNEVAEIKNVRDRHIEEVKSENLIYLGWTGNVLSTFEEFDFPEEFTKDCSDYLVVMYQILKKQAKLNKLAKHRKNINTTTS